VLLFISWGSPLPSFPEEWKSQCCAWSLWTDVLPDSTETELPDMANSPAVGKVGQGAMVSRKRKRSERKARELPMTVETEQRKCWSVLTCLLLATVTVLGQNSTITTLTASTTTPAFGANVTFTATVTGANPTGTVTFIGNIYNTLGTCTLSNGSCTFNISNLIPGDPSLVAGAQSLVASYGGDGNNRPSQSPPVTVTAGPRTLTSTTTTLLVSPISGSYMETILR